MKIKEGVVLLILHDLKPVKSGGNCFDDIIETISQGYQRSYQMMYIESLRFGFNKEDISKTIGENLQLDFRSRFEHVEKYNGYRLQMNREASFDSFLSIAREYISRNEPICIFIDTYYVPWDPGYGKFHYFYHILVVVGYDDLNQNIFLTDPFFQRMNVPLPLEVCRQAFQRFMTIDLLPEKPQDRDEVFADVGKHLKEHVESTRTHMLEFAAALPTIDFAKEIHGFEKFGETPLFQKLSLAIVERVNYARMLKYLDQRFVEPKLGIIADQIKNLSDKWAVIRGYISKMNILSTQGTHLSSMDSTANRIVEAANIEYQQINQLIDILKQTHSDSSIILTKDMNQQVPIVNVGEIFPIQMEHLFNLRGIENEDNTADFDSEGYSFAREGLPQNRRLAAEEMSFEFPASISSGFDNMICQLQSIELPEEIYNGIMILGCSETGSDLGIIIVEYEDDTNELVHFGFSNWRGFHPIDNEIIAWKSMATHRELGKSSSEVYLYAKNSVLNSHKKARCLILPEVPNMHIFAISMWK
jgi:hypothetical protein